MIKHILFMNITISLWNNTFYNSFKIIINKNEVEFQSLTFEKKTLKEKGSFLIHNTSMKGIERHRALHNIYTVFVMVRESYIFPLYFEKNMLMLVVLCVKSLDIQSITFPL